MKRKLVLAGALVFVVPITLLVVMSAVGASLPETHVTRLSIELAQDPEEVWALISDFSATPTWRQNPGAMVKRVERLEDRNGNPVWREHYDGGDAVSYETVESERPRRLVRRIADEDVPWTGQWEFDLEPAPSGTRITITQSGTVRYPFARVISHYVIGSTYVERYLNDLSRRFGEEPAFDG